MLQRALDVNKEQTVKLKQLGLSIPKIAKRSRSSAQLMLRYSYIYYLKETRKMSHVQIGLLLGYTHATVINSLKRVNEILETRTPVEWYETITRNVMAFKATDQITPEKFLKNRKITPTDDLCKLLVEYSEEVLRNILYNPQ